MKNILYSIVFGSPEAAFLWLLAAQTVSAVFFAAVFAAFAHRPRRGENAPREKPARTESAPDIPEDGNEPLRVESYGENPHAENAAVRYDRSFTARLIQSDEETKAWYAGIKNEILNYKKSKASVSWKRESFRANGKVVARLSFRGKTLCLFLPLFAAEPTYGKFIDGGGPEYYGRADTPLMYRIENADCAACAKNLIAAVMENYKIPRADREAEEFCIPYEDTDELVCKGLVRRVDGAKRSEAAPGG